MEKVPDPQKDDFNLESGEKTIDDYIEALEDLFIIEDIDRRWIYFGIKEE